MAGIQQIGFMRTGLPKIGLARVGYPRGREGTPVEAALSVLPRYVFLTPANLNTAPAEVRTKAEWKAE